MNTLQTKYGRSPIRTVEFSFTASTAASSLGVTMMPSRRSLGVPLDSFQAILTALASTNPRGIPKLLPNGSQHGAKIDPNTKSRIKSEQIASSKRLRSISHRFGLPPGGHVSLFLFLCYCGFPQYISSFYMVR